MPVHAGNDAMIPISVTLIGVRIHIIKVAWVQISHETKQYRTVLCVKFDLFDVSDEHIENIHN